jgi:hypothetical protein
VRSLRERGRSILTSTSATSAVCVVSASRETNVRADRREPRDCPQLPEPSIEPRAAGRLTWRGPTRSRGFGAFGATHAKMLSLRCCGEPIREADTAQWNDCMASESSQPEGCPISSWERQAPPPRPCSRLIPFPRNHRRLRAPRLELCPGLPLSRVHPKAEAPRKATGALAPPREGAFRRPVTSAAARRMQAGAFPWI